MKAITLEDAIVLAATLHAGQYDKQNKPYILHPLRVMQNAPAHLQVPAVLHDVLEDCNVTADLLSDRVQDPRIMPMNLVRITLHVFAVIRKQQSSRFLIYKIILIVCGV